MRAGKRNFPFRRKKTRKLSSILFLGLTFLILFHLAANIAVRYYPGVLGISSAIKVEDLVKLTNEQRTKNGLSPLRFNPDLAAAAARKGENMFSEDYWAHISPSGKDPWFWIDQSGYDYVFAGENLAKDFVEPQSVVSAWMASPSHRDNVLNKKYEEIGIAVLDGNLNGYKTTLVVQMFATPRPVPKVASKPEATVFPTEETPQSVYQISPRLTIQPSLLPSSQTKPPIVEPFYLVKVISLGLVLLLLGIFSLDVWAVATGKITKVGSHSLAHAALLGILLLAIIYTNVGVIA